MRSIFGARDCCAPTSAWSGNRLPAAEPFRFFANSEKEPPPASRLRKKPFPAECRQTATAPRDKFSARERFEIPVNPPFGKCRFAAKKVGEPPQTEKNPTQVVKMGRSGLFGSGLVQKKNTVRSDIQKKRRSGVIIRKKNRTF